MTTEKLKAMCKRTIDFHKLDIPHKHVDEILDMCDGIYEENLNKEKARHIRAENVFITALGKKTFYEIKEAMEEAKEDG